jgi:hypothetical protein
VKNSHATLSSVELLQELYCENEEFANIPEIDDEINSPNGRTIGAFKGLCHTVNGTARMLEGYPPLPEYLDFIQSINSILAKYKTIRSNDAHERNAIGEILAAQIDYLRGLSNNFDNYMDDYSNDKAGYIDASCYNYNDSRDYTDEDSDDYKIRQELQTLDYHIADPNVSDVVVKYILTPSFGQHGIAYVTELKFPIFVSILPHSLLNENLLSFWKFNFPNHPSKDTVYQLARPVDDIVLQELEGLVLSKIRTSQYHSIEKALLNKSLSLQSLSGRDDDDAGSEFGMNTGSRPSGRKPPPKGKGKKPYTSGDHGPSHPQGRDPSDNASEQESDTPDDSNYVPNQSLLILSKGWIKIADELPSTDLTHDHMTRFETSSEVSQPISKGQIRRGEHADWFILKRTALGTQQYVVTFTRKSKKPIFNPVT